MPIGFGTLINVGAILVGSGVGLVVGGRFRPAHREMVTDCLGLVVLVIGGFSVVSAGSAELASVVYSGVLVVLFAMLFGGLLGTSLRLEERIEDWSDRLRHRLHAGKDGGRFTEGLVTASLVFCVGPLAILGPITEGLGGGAEQLMVKSMLDGFASVVFASSFGGGVALSAIIVGLYQGFWTLIGALAGDVLSAAEVDALTATGGVILLALGFRLTGIKAFKVGDMLPALMIAPLLVWAVSLVR